MLTFRDKASITEQLGELPANAHAVAVHCPAGHPCVITCYPLQRIGERVVPFPTLYWLTCPRLSAQLSHLERDGVVRDLTSELADNPAIRADLLRDHENYIAQRWAMLTEHDRSLVSEQGLLNAFQSRGIGGLSNFAAVKCLHLHVAHHLACGSTIGALIANRFGVHRCDEVCNSSKSTRTTASSKQT